MNGRLRALVLVFVLIVGFACTAIFSVVETMHQKRDIYRQLDQTIQLQRQFIDKWLDSRMSDIRIIADDAAANKGDLKHLEQLIGIITSQHSEFRSISFIHPDGMSLTGINARDRSYFKLAMEGKASISDVIRSRMDGKQIIVFAAPVIGGAGSSIGVILGTVELTTIEQLMRQFTYGERGQTYIVDRQGTLITGEGSGGEQPVKIRPALMDQALNGVKSKRAYDDYRGIPVYGVYNWAKNGSWLIVGEAARQDVLASLYTEITYAGLIILLSMVLAALVMLRVSKRIAAPVNHLLRGVRKVKEGGYDYRIHPAVLDSTTMEFQQLGAAFNAMSDTIEERTEALRTERNFASSIVDTAQSLIVVLDKEGRILRFNRSCEQATGYSFDEVRNASLFEKLVPEDEHAALQSFFQCLLTTGSGTVYENHWRTRTGETRLIAWSNTIVREPRGDIMRIIGIGTDITEQRKVERELRESEERFRLIVGSMEEIVATFDSELILTGIYGRTMDDYAVHNGAPLRGMTLHELMQPEDASLHEDAQRLALREKTTVIDWSMYMPDGAERSYQTSYSAFRDNAGDIKGVISVSREITQLKEAEAAYRETQERMNGILESITDAFIALNTDWTFAYVNSEAKRKLSRRHAEIMGRHLLEVLPEIRETAIYEHCRLAMEEQLPYSVEGYMPFLDAWYEVHIYPSRDGLSIYFQDVSVRKELEQTAAESQMRLATIIETVPSGIIVVGKDGRIAMANRMAETIFGMDKETIVSRKYDDRIWELYDMDGRFLPVEAFPVSIARRTGLAVTNVEYMYKRPDGERAIISCNCSPLFDAEGNLNSVLVALSDITGRVAIQSALQAANEELQKLSALDGLTGIFNRRYFNEQLRAEWSRHALQQETLSLILLDIDCFKAYNDAYGHLGGDTCLKTTAALIRSSLHAPNRFVARYGGEEFAVVLPGTSLEEAAALAESLRRRIERKEIEHANSKVSRFVTISLGVASVVPAPGSDEESLVSAADECLYEAKRKRNRVVVQSEHEHAAHAGTRGIPGEDGGDGLAGILT
ncbi:PAS domain-containing protein [Paenibacillus lycopersici]|uniref:PAS domain-containing protein n=1 Tax=Paenibacillus lycopersici TaxID=2704462 RepID=A0A6C0FYG5_9BACL|nr:PAS domain-containing protein [Paenibacillus lycopersici]QHT62146.1 PAS domain-containing protein [Paenibacillus lycopersici]